MNSSSAPNPDVTLRRARPLLGTYVEIAVAALGADCAERAIGRAFAAIERVQRRMSPHESNSDVARINAAPLGRSIRVHRATWRVLRAARSLSEASHGVFDVTCGLRATHVGWRALELLPCNRVRRRADIRIDLGGIAKGFAVDEAVAALRRAGVRRGSVNAGGDLRVFGDEPVPVVVRHPAQPGRLVPVAVLREGAFATSANYLDARGRGRLRRPDGGRLWIGRGSVSVHAPTCLLADALTKIVAAIGPRAAAGILRRHGATALAIRSDGEMCCSETEVAHAA